jgi:ABC-type multidrug transport system fused ATPase/permease subunit
VFPDFAYLNKSFEPLVVVLLGGIQSFFGPLAGAVGFKILETFIARQWPVYWPLFLGSAVVLVVVALPQGFVGLLQRRSWRIRAATLVLQTVGLRKHFGGVQAVNGVDLAVPEGDLRAIIGPNGAGKTTLFNLITGDLPHDSGQIFFRVRGVSGLPPQALCRRGLARTFQVTSIFRRLTALENVQTALLTHHRRHHDIFRPARRLYRDEAMILLDRVGLAAQAAKPSGSCRTATSGGSSWRWPSRASPSSSCSTSPPPAWRRASATRSWPWRRASPPTRG